MALSYHNRKVDWRWMTEKVLVDSPVSNELSPTLRPGIFQGCGFWLLSWIQIAKKLQATDTYLSFQSMYSVFRKATGIATLLGLFENLIWNRNQPFKFFLFVLLLFFVNKAEGKAQRWEQLFLIPIQLLAFLPTANTWPVAGTSMCRMQVCMHICNWPNKQFHWSPGHQISISRCHLDLYWWCSWKTFQSLYSLEENLA